MVAGAAGVVFAANRHLYSLYQTQPPVFLGLTPHLGSLAVGTAWPLAQSLLAPSLPRAMENFYDFLTFLQLFGSEEGAGAAHKHVYV